jgi:hypothetical protein
MFLNHLEKYKILNNYFLFKILFLDWIKHRLLNYTWQILKKANFQKKYT